MRPFPLLVFVLLASGCLQSADSPPAPPTASPPECPLAAVPQRGTIYTKLGEYDTSSPASASYDDFEWDWPAGSPIAMNVSAEWDAGTLGEKEMELRVFLHGDFFEPFGMAFGPSPIVLNFTMTVPKEDGLAVGMKPQAQNGMPVAVNKEAFETHVTMVQTLLCS
jgi:hypothetical protein